VSNAFKNRGFLVRTRVPFRGRKDLGDIDLLLLEPSIGKMILAELKWVIPPGEPFEQLTQADKETVSARDRVRPRVQFVLENQTQFLGMFGEDAKGLSVVSVYGILLMRGFCGMNHKLAEVYPTIDADFLLDIMSEIPENRAFVRWIMNREYMPKAGRDYSVKEAPFTFGPFRVKINGVFLN
jgi:hypothetical protein